MIREETTMSKIRIRVADIEIEFEGSEEFIQEQIPELLQDIAQMRVVSDTDADIEEIEEISAEAREQFQNLGLNTIAQRINAETGRDLIIAAAAYLTFVEESPTFSRRAILEAMKKASHYYKKSYSQNLSKYLKRLVKDGVLLQTASGLYALSADTRKELEKKIVG